MTTRVKRVLLLMSLALAGVIYLAYSNGLLQTYQTTVTNDQPLVLQNDDVLILADTRYIQKNDIILKDNARLIVTNALLEHRQEYAFQYSLEAHDHAQLIIRDSALRSSAWINWNFRDNASLEYDHVRQTFSDIWHSFTGQARAVIQNARFHGTLGEETAIEIENAPSTFLELVLPVGAIVDEAFPKKLTDYSFPNADDTNINLSLTVKNSTASSWGITVNPRSTVTIRDTSSLIVTLAVGQPWEGVTATLENLRPMFYTDQTWKIEDMVLRLLKTKTGKWSPIVGGTNTLIVKNSELADNAFSSGNAQVILENSSTSFVRAQDSVEMTLINSTVTGDVVATDNGKIRLIKTKVTGQIVEEGNGQVIEQ